MRVGWIADQARSVGGAELTQAEFKAAAPEDVEIVECPVGAVRANCDRYVVHNCVTYSAADLEPITKRPAVKYWHDTGPWLGDEKRALLFEHTTAVCCSPLQAMYLNVEAILIPPPVEVGRFERAATCMPDADRAGTCSVASWRNFGKGARRVLEWSAEHERQVDFYGDGEWAPEGSQGIPYASMPELLARYQTFVFLPTVVEPFGRVVVEAWAAGCELITNRLVGALHWIEQDTDAIGTAPKDFWDVVLL